MNKSLNKPYSLVFAIAICAGHSDWVWAEPANQAATTTVIARWKAKKKMAVLISSEVEGVSRQVSAQMVGEHWRFSVPLKSFDSKQTTRDREVVKILGGEGLEFPQIHFEVPKASVNQAIQNRSGVLKGFLEFADGTRTQIAFNVVCEASVSCSAIWSGRFQELGLEPPSVVGGLVSRVLDDLMLEVVLPFATIKAWGLGSVR